MAQKTVNLKLLAEYTPPPDPPEPNAEFNLEFTSYTVNEGLTQDIKILRTIRTDQVLDVDWAAINVSVLPVSGTERFQIGEAEKIVQVTAQQVDSNEQGTFELSNPQYVSGPISNPILGPDSSAFFVVNDTSEPSTNPDFIVRQGGGGDATTIAGGIALLQANYDGTRDWILEVQADTPGGINTFIDDWIHFTSHANSINAKQIIRARDGDTIKIQGSGSASSGLVGIQLRDFCMVDGDPENNGARGFLFDGDDPFSSGLPHTASKMNYVNLQDITCQFGIIKGIRGQYFRKTPISIGTADPQNIMYVDSVVTNAGDWYNPDPDPNNPDHNDIAFCGSPNAANGAFVRFRTGDVDRPPGGHGGIQFERGTRFVIHDCISSDDWTGHLRKDANGDPIDLPLDYPYPYMGNRSGPGTEWEGTQEIFLEHSRMCWSLPASDNYWTGMGKFGGVNNTYMFNSYIYCPHGDGGSAVFRYTSGSGIDGCRRSNDIFYFLGGPAIQLGPPFGTTINYPKFRGFKFYNMIFLDIWNDSTYNQVGGAYSGRTTIWMILQNASQYLQDPMPWYERIEIRNCIIPQGFRLAVQGNGETFDTTINYYTADQLNAHPSGNFSGIIEVDNHAANTVFANPNTTKTRIYDRPTFEADFAPIGVASGSAQNIKTYPATRLNGAANGATFAVNDAAWFRDNRGHDTTYLPRQQIQIDGVGLREVTGVNLVTNQITVNASVSASDNTAIYLVDMYGNPAYSIGAIQ